MKHFGFFWTFFSFRELIEILPSQNFQYKYIEPFGLPKENKFPKVKRSKKESSKPLTSEDDHELYYFYPFDLLKWDKVALLLCKGKMQRDKKLKEGRNE